MGRRRDRYAFVTMLGPVLAWENGKRGSSRDPEDENNTDWRCSGEQYQAFWHRPHHIAVVFPQRRQGLLINVIASIVYSKEGEMRRMKR